MLRGPIEDVAFSIIIIGNIPEKTFHNAVIVIVVEAKKEWSQLASYSHPGIISLAVGLQIVSAVLNQIAAQLNAKVVGKFVLSPLVFSHHADSIYFYLIILNHHFLIIITRVLYVAL